MEPLVSRIFLLKKKKSILILFKINQKTDNLNLNLNNGKTSGLPIVLCPQLEE
jgi:hypothetical protein